MDPFLRVDDDDRERNCLLTEHYLHSALGYKPPRQFEREYYTSHGTQFTAACQDVAGKLGFSGPQRRPEPQTPTAVSALGVFP
jgi:hypothetical protein